MRLKNTFKFSNNDINKFIFLLRKGVYYYEYMDNWERFNKTALPEKEEFYSNLSIGDITDADYMHAERVCKVFQLKNVGECQNLYLKSSTLLLNDFFKNFRKMYLKIYELDPAKFLSAPGLEWQAVLNKAVVKLELLTNINVLLMFVKGNRGGIYQVIDIKSY